MGPFEYDELFRRKFRWAFDVVDELEQLIYQTEGIFFVNHLYSIEQLMAMPHHNKIYAIAEKIGSDATLWHQNGQLPEWAIQEYLRQRDELEKRLRETNRKIRERQPTWWESARGILVAFVNAVMMVMPSFVRGLLGYGGDLPRLPRKD